MSGYTVGPWRVDPEANEIVADGHRRRLTPKAMRALQILLEAEGRVVTRADLCGRIPISDEGLSRVINEVREALGDRARRPAYIETIPRRGYRTLAREPAGAGRRRRLWSWPAVLVGIVGAGLLALALWRDELPDPAAATSEAVVLDDIVRLTAFEGAARYPSVAGSSAWFIRGNPQGNDPRPFRIDLDSLQMTPVDLAGEPTVIAPSGDVLATLTAAGGGCRVDVVLPDRPEPVSAECLRPTGGVDWRSDGRALVFEHRSGGIGELNVGSGEIRILTDPSGGFSDVRPRYLPGTAAIAFIRSNGIEGELYRLDLQHGHAAAITSDGQMVFDHVWPSAAQVILSSDRSGFRRLWSLRPDGPQWQDLGQPGAMYMGFRAPHLVFELPSYRADIIRWSDGESTVVAGSARYDNQPRLAPDGSRLAFLSTRTESPGLWISGPDGSRPRLVQQAENARITRPYWLDQAHLLYVVYDPAGSHLWVTGLDGNGVQRVGPELAPREAVADSDGKIFFLGRDDRGPGLFSIMESGQIEAVARGPFHRLEIDGKGRPYVSAPNDNAIVRLDGDRPSKPIAGLSASHALHWTIAGDWLFYVGPDGLVRHSLATGEQELLDAPLPSTVGLGLAAARDGRSLYIARFHSYQVDLLHATVDIRGH